jgi:hypothetical protein
LFIETFLDDFFVLGNSIIQIQFFAAIIKKNLNMSDEEDNIDEFIDNEDSKR